MSVPVITFAQLKELLGLKKNNESDYPVLMSLAQSVHDALENYTGRILAEVEKYSVTAFIEGPTNLISLSALPITSIESFAIGGSDISSDQYYLWSYGLRLKSAISESEVDIVYKGGFSEIPGDIIRAELMQTAYEFQNKDHIGASSVTTEGGSVQRPALSLLRVTKDLLSNYIHVDKFI